MAINPFGWQSAPSDGNQPLRMAISPFGWQSTPKKAIFGIPAKILKKCEK